MSKKATSSRGVPPLPERKSHPTKSPSTPKPQLKFAASPEYPDEVLESQEASDVLGRLSDKSTNIMKQLIPDPSQLEETVMGETSRTVFSMQLPPVVQLQPPLHPSEDPSSDVHALLTAPWYPHRGETSIYGDNTASYLGLLSRAYGAESETFTLLRSAETMGRHIGCLKTINLWNRLNSLFGSLNMTDMPDVAADICHYLIHDPESVYPYIKCLNRVRGYLHNPSQSVRTFEETATNMTSVFAGLLDESRAHQDETLKYNNQISNMSANLANLQEMLEQTVLKVKKLDLLHIPESIPSSGISIPSTSAQVEGARISELDIEIPGEYTSSYSVKIKNGTIISMVPPTNLPELERLMTYPTQVQHVVLNLDQMIFLNRLSSVPEFKKAFIMEPSTGRSAILKELCRGIKRRNHQWIQHAGIPK